MGDCICKPTNIFFKSPYIGAKVWDIHHFEALKDNFGINIQQRCDLAEDQFGDFNELVASSEAKGLLNVARKVCTSDTWDVLLNIVQTGIKLMDTSWENMNSIIVTKYAHPNIDHGNTYEAAIKNNISAVEKQILVRYLVIIHGLSMTFNSFNFDTISSIYNGIHQNIQSFVQTKLAEYAALFGKKKTSYEGAIKYCLDIISSSGAKSDDENAARTPPASTHTPMFNFQFQMLRLVVFTILQERSKAKGIFKDSGLKEEQYNELQTFMNQLHTYEYITRFESSILCLSDFSHFWFREFNIDLGKQVQVSGSCFHIQLLVFVGSVTPLAPDRRNHLVQRSKTAKEYFSSIANVQFSRINGTS